MLKNKKRLTIIVTTIFLMVPVLSSFISTVHLIDFFTLGNYTWMSILLAICYEIGSITSFITPFILDKINKNLLWTIFIILVFLQIFGNIYFSFNYINIQMINDPNWLNSFKEFLAYFVGGDISLIKIIIASLIGIPIPLISLFFLKSLIEYANQSTIKDIEVKTEFSVPNEISYIVGNEEKINHLK